jgi:prepilin-type N-terminal cleavage/methylation domain-containing protein
MKVKGLMTITKSQIEGKKLNQQRGFTLLEMLVVIAMAMVIAATAAPTMTQVVSNARIRGTMSGMATYTQRVRADAIRTNTTKSIWNILSSGEYMVYSADGNNTPPGLAGADGLMPAGKQVVYVGNPTSSNVPAILDTTMAFGSSTIAVANGAISFNSRGIPCLWDTSTGLCGNSGSQAFVWYYVFQPPFGSNRWAALSVSPAGRIKNWYWDGAAWKN